MLDIIPMFKNNCDLPSNCVSSSTGSVFSPESAGTHGSTLHIKHTNIVIRLLILPSNINEMTIN